MAFLQAESDNTCKRNAFAALSAISHAKALEYLNSVFDQIANSDELTQLVLIEFIRKDAVLNSGNKVCFFFSFDKFSNEDTFLTYGVNRRLDTSG